MREGSSSDVESVTERYVSVWVVRETQKGGVPRGQLEETPDLTCLKDDEVEKFAPVLVT